MKRRLAALGACIALALSLAAFTAGPVSAVANDVCVTQYEYANGWNGGDRWQECGPYIGDGDYTNNTNGLHSGCESVATWPFTQPNWNDCVSAIKIDNLPGGYKVVFYINTGYGFTNHCFDANGDTRHNFNNAENDRTSSYRILTGNC